MTKAEKIKLIEDSLEEIGNSMLKATVLIRAVATAAVVFIEAWDEITTEES